MYHRETTELDSSVGFKKKRFIGDQTTNAVSGSRGKKENGRKTSAFLFDNNKVYTG